jgi:hypothetical protein
MPSRPLQVSASQKLIPVRSPVHVLCGARVKPCARLRRYVSAQYPGWPLSERRSLAHDVGLAEVSLGVDDLVDALF